MIKYEVPVPTLTTPVHPSFDYKNTASNWDKYTVVEVDTKYKTYLVFQAPTVSAPATTGTDIVKAEQCSTLKADGTTATTDFVTDPVWSAKKW